MPGSRITFVTGATLVREPATEPHAGALPVWRNGPPGTSVRMPSGRMVPIPTDQIVAVDEADGLLVVTFGGMRFEGVADGQLRFWRERDVWPEAQLSPERRPRMTLEIDMVEGVEVAGRRRWPAPVVSINEGTVK